MKFQEVETAPTLYAVDFEPEDESDGDVRVLVTPPAPASPAALITNEQARTVSWLMLLAETQRGEWRRLLYCHVGKRAIDLVLASLLLVLASPLLLVAALAIRLDSPGPAFFRQRRIGRGGKPFTLIKFRTMRTVPPHAELQFFRDERGQLRHKVRHDPRVTRVGRWLRRTSLDELPQLLNVVRGDMSLIGPRPELPQLVRTYEPWQHQRHLVRPGLTGWWQVSGRSDRPMHEHTELDLYYIEHLSWRLDLLILWKTTRVVLSGLGAF